MNLELKSFEWRTDIAKQRDLFRLSFPENIGTPSETAEHYHWKFHSFPAEPKSYEYVAYEGDKMAGYYAALPYRYVCGGKEYTAGMVCDVMTHPHMRGKGVFAKLGRYATDNLKGAGVGFTTGYPIRPEVIPGHLKVGWKILFRLPMYMSFLRSNAALKTKGLGWLSLPVNLGISMVRLMFRPRADNQYTVADLSRDAFLAVPEYAEFFRRWLASQKIALLKSQEFLRWRTGAPGTSYRFVIAKADNRLVAVVLARATVLQGVPCLAILDVMTLPGNESALGGIFAELQRSARSAGCEALVTMMSPTWAGRYRMLRNGFIRTPFVFSLIVKRLDDAVDENLLAEESNWHLMWVDSDDL